MSEWKEYKINEIGKVVTGTTPSSKNSEDFGNDIMFVTPSDYKSYTTYIRKTDRYLSEIGREKLKNRILPTGSVMVTCIGSDMGKVALNPEEVITNQQVNSIIPNHTVNNAFLYYKLKDEYDTLRMYGGEGTAVPIVNKSTFENIELLLPPLSEQQRIAEILSSLDDKIDLLHKQNETLEQLAETIFRQWFGEKEKDSWPIGRVEDLFILQRGFDLPIQKRIDGIYPIYTSSGMSGRHSEFKVKGPGVTTGRSGVLGNVYYIQEDFWPLNTSLFVKDFKNSSPLHAYFTLKTIDLNNFNAGSAVPTLNRNHVHDLSIEIPPIKLIHEFDKLIKPFFKKLNSNQTQINHLTTLRDTLLPKLMSGEIRVNLAEA